MREKSSCSYEQSAMGHIAAIFFLLFLIAHPGLCTENLNIDFSEQISLEELEQFVGRGSQVLSRAAVLDEMRLRFEHIQAKSGLHLTGDIRAGYAKERYDNGNLREYYPSRLAIGLTHPLFGNISEEKTVLSRAHSRVSENAHKLELAKRIALESLRMNYILLWGSLEKIRLAEAFLQSKEEVETQLRHRRDRGYLLESDYLEFMTAYDLVERDVRVIKNVAHRAKDIILLITDRETLPRGISEPVLSLPVYSLLELESTVMSSDPELKIYQNLVDEQLQVMRSRYWSDIKANLSLRGVISSSEYVYSDTGYGAMLSMDVDLPFDFLKTEDTSRKAERAHLRSVQKKLEIISSQLRATVSDRLRILHSGEINREFAAKRLQAAVELIREREFQRSRNPGEVKEKLQQARYHYYRVAMEYIDAEVQRLQAVAGLLRFSGKDKDKREVAPLLNPDDGLFSISPETVKKSHGTTIIIRALDIETTGRETIAPYQLTRKNFQNGDKNNQSFAVYLWNSEPLTDIIFFNEKVWQEFSNLMVGRVLISLNRQQIEAASLPSGIDKLQRLIRSANKSGLEVSLLLGEPTWILPDGRKNLLQIISLLHDIPFASVHLDLEPNQLDERALKTDYLLKQLLRTIQAVDQVSPWPVEISLHPRYLDNKQNSFCFGCALENIDLNRVSLMIYTTNMEKVTNWVETIHADFPALKLSVAQSVETILGPENSYAEKGMDSFREAMEFLNKSSVEMGIYSEIYLQDWSSYYNLGHEN